MPNCPRCGAQNDAAAKFCAKCGAPLAPAAAPSAPVAPTASAAPSAAVPPFEYYTGAFRKYTLIEGRAHRPEYWYFFLFSMLVSIGLSILDRAFGFNYGNNDESGVLQSLYSLVALVPSICIGVRRMHDSGHSGWWILLPFVNIYFLLIDGTKGPNAYGADPKGRTA